MIEPVKFTYDNDITVISKKQFEAHIKLYEGYVKKVNEIDEKLSGSKAGRPDANATYSLYRGLKEGETYALDGSILHELYFQNLGGEQGNPHRKTIEVFNSYFGGFNMFKEDFTACCNAARGWCLFVYEHRTGTFRNILLDLHNLGNVTLSYPILVMDMYEHACATCSAIEKIAA